MSASALPAPLTTVSTQLDSTTAHVTPTQAPSKREYATDLLNNLALPQVHQNTDYICQQSSMLRACQALTNPQERQSCEAVWNTVCQNI